jgi:hypothetical protein
VIFFYKRAARVCADRPIELAAIARQTERFERELLLTQAKAHLLRGEFAAASGAFEGLSGRANNVSSSLIAGVGRRMPRALLWAYQLKSGLRTLRAFAR